MSCNNINCLNKSDTIQTQINLNIEFIHNYEKKGFLIFNKNIFFLKRVFLTRFYAALLYTSN